MDRWFLIYATGVMALLLGSLCLWMRRKLRSPKLDPLLSSATDEELIAYIDRWVTLLEQEKYQEAVAFIDHEPGWTATSLRAVIKGYGDASRSQRVTLEGRPTDVKQNKEVSRHAENRRKHIGYVWYDLNIDGLVSDLTAIFQMISTNKGIVLRLESIHVM